MKFSDIQFKPHLLSIGVDNAVIGSYEKGGLFFSIIRGWFSYGGPYGLYEVMVPGGDVIGHLDEEGVENTINNFGDEIEITIHE